MTSNPWIFSLWNELSKSGNKQWFASKGEQCCECYAFLSLPWQITITSRGYADNYQAGVGGMNIFFFSDLKLSFKWINLLKSTMTFFLVGLWIIALVMGSCWIRCLCFKTLINVWWSFMIGCYCFVLHLSGLMTGVAQKHCKINKVLGCLVNLILML